MSYSASERAAIEAALEAVLSSRQFRGVADPSRVLRCMVERHLADLTGPVQEHELAQEAGLRSFPDADTRTAVGTVREKLLVYYSRPPGDAAEFEIPRRGDASAPKKGQGYALIIRLKAAGAAQAVAPAGRIESASSPSVEAHNAKAEVVPSGPAQGVVDTSPSPTISATPPTTTSGAWAKWLARLKSVDEYMASPTRFSMQILIVGLVVVLIGLGWTLLRPLTGFTKLGEQGFVGHTEFVEGIGPRTSGNRYLVVEASDQFFVQGKLNADPWQVSARFGDANTPPGTTFRVFILVTPTPLSAAIIDKNALSDSQQFFSTVVRLK